MKVGDLIEIRNVRDYNGKPFEVVRLLDFDDTSVRVAVEGISGYFIFSREHVVGVVCPDQTPAGDNKDEIN
tara:strand:+ start:2241 stop:2453 length:213 start_codon:yes stop_codon:yes gene_type:complete